MSAYGREKAHPWWGLNGPARFLDRAAAGVARASGLLALSLPFPPPDGLIRALVERLDEQASAGPMAVDALTGALGRSPLRVLAMAAGLEMSGIRVIADLLDDPTVADMVFVVHGVRTADWRQWSLFLRAFRTERETGSRDGAPSIVMVVPPMVAPDDARAAFGCAPLRWMNAVSRLDTRLFVEGLLGRAADDLLSRVAVETTVELAGWDPELARALIALETRYQLDPRALLAGHATDALGGRVPCWENGLVDMWDGAPHVSTLALLAAGDDWSLRSRIWSAQVRAVFPFINAIRVAYVDKYRALLDKHMPLRKDFNGREVVYDRAEKLEFYDLQQLLREVLPQEELTLLEDCRKVRHMLAHVDVAPSWMIEGLSAQWERLEDAFPAPMTGWDWPRCGQDLVLLVGPSGGGKSTYAERNYDPADVVSSDDIRIGLFGSLEVQGDQGPVFRRVREEAILRLSTGRRVVIDATHLKSADRLANVRLAPLDIAVEYVVIDRPMPEKLADAGWRVKRPGLLESHARAFTEGLPDIKACDGMRNVKLTLVGMLALDHGADDLVASIPHGV